jgi:hypothetical protein
MAGDDLLYLAGIACTVGIPSRSSSYHEVSSATLVCAMAHVRGSRIVTARDTSALLVVDMQNDFLIKTSSARLPRLMEGVRDISTGP